MDRDPRGRVISVAYVGLVRPKTFKISAVTDAEQAQWFKSNKLTALVFDHAKYIKIQLQIMVLKNLQKD